MLSQKIDFFFNSYILFIILLDIQIFDHLCIFSGRVGHLILNLFYLSILRCSTNRWANTLVEFYTILGLFFFDFPFSLSVPFFIFSLFLILFFCPAFTFLLSEILFSFWITHIFKTFLYWANIGIFLFLPFIALVLGPPTL